MKIGQNYERETIQKLLINNIDVTDLNAILNEQKQTFTQTLTSRKKDIDINTINYSHFFNLNIKRFTENGKQ